ncbi:hypothetical protein [Sphingomonas sp. S-NIH.Pt15_0812]|uniref:hypothetical protein n=1 Tax=Sphingomonas sp. S-NIH.Pt15_0812 TaxID=1920129 RepID=UPI000F7EE91B|nr:hypothetical protein [Sphingomonas sp. S-NIH.Pt15_0812]
MTEPANTCCCSSLSDLAAVPMGGYALDERVFATIENVRDHGGDAWWLYLSRCRVCGQDWMIAQEERIFDEHFLRRLDADEATRILTENEWPSEFLTYEQVLETGHALGVRPCVFLDQTDGSLVWTVEDLKKTRPDISAQRIAQLLGVPVGQAERILAKT